MKPLQKITAHAGYVFLTLIALLVMLAVLLLVLGACSMLVRWIVGVWGLI